MKNTSVFFFFFNHDGKSDSEKINKLFFLPQPMWKWSRRLWRKNLNWPKFCNCKWPWPTAFLTAPKPCESVPWRKGGDGGREGGSDSHLNGLELKHTFALKLKHSFQHFFKSPLMNHQAHFLILNTKCTMLVKHQNDFAMWIKWDQINFRIFFFFLNKPTNKLKSKSLLTTLHCTVRWYGKNITSHLHYTQYHTIMGDYSVYIDLLSTFRLFWEKKFPRKVIQDQFKHKTLWVVLL